jgi:hypothetical protein
MKHYIFKIGYKTFKVKIAFGRYPTNNHLHMWLEEIENGKLFTNITANICTQCFFHLNEDEIIVKTYNCKENADQWLIDNNIATHTGVYMEQNMIKMPIMKLTSEFLEENKAAIAAATLK